MTLALESPVRVSAFALPVRFSMLRKVAIATPPMVAVPSDAPFSVAVTPDAMTREGRGVGPEPAVQQVHGAARVRARIERVVARAAREGVGVGVAREAVVEAGTRQVLEPAERVRARIDRVLRRALQGEADRHAGRGARIGGGVVAAGRRPACRCPDRLR